MELKGSKTEKNLWEAFAGESMARNKYTYFASVAKKEGYEQISAIFLETADNRLRLVNSQLKKFGVSETNGRPLVGQLLALVSDVVKSSGALGLHAIHGSAQSFERHLIELHGRLDFGGSDLIPVVVALNDLLDEVEKFRKVGSRLQAFSIRNAPANLAQDALGEAVA